MKKFIFLAGLGIGFVIGSRAGRGPYESLERTARQVADDPEVQRRATQAKDKAPEVASAAQGAVVGAAGAAKERLSNSSDATLDQDAAKVADASADTDLAAGSAAAGGDAEVGEDKPLSS